MLIIKNTRAQPTIQLQKKKHCRGPLHPPGVEPGARPWEDPMLPLHHERDVSWSCPGGKRHVLGGNVECCSGPLTCESLLRGWEVRVEDGAMAGMGCGTLGGENIIDVWCVRKLESFARYEHTRAGGGRARYRYRATVKTAHSVQGCFGV